MKSKLELFKNEKFGEVRSFIDEKGMPWFAGLDVARALGYVRPAKAIKDHVDKEDKKHLNLNEIQQSSVSGGLKFLLVTMV